MRTMKIICAGGAPRRLTCACLPADPAGPGVPCPLKGYPQRLADATAPWTGRFAVFDRALEAHHPAGVPHQHLAILAVRPG
jgi:hypothetical protein